MNEQKYNLENHILKEKTEADKIQEKELISKRAEQRRADVFRSVILEFNSGRDQDYQRLINLIEERGISYSAEEKHEAEFSKEQSGKFYKINFNDITSRDFLQILAELKEKNIDFEYKI